MDIKIGFRERSSEGIINAKHITIDLKNVYRYAQMELSGNVLTIWVNAEEDTILSESNREELKEMGVTVMIETTFIRLHYFNDAVVLSSLIIIEN